MEDFQLIHRPPAQTTLPDAEVACGAISAAVCLALDWQDFEKRKIDFAEVIQVGAYLYGSWSTAPRSTTDEFCESFDLLSDLPKVKQYMETKGKRTIILSGVIKLPAADDDPRPPTPVVDSEASSFVRLVDAVATMGPGDNASLVHNRSTYTLVCGPQCFYFYDSHGQGYTLRGEVWQCPKDARRIVEWLCSNRLRAALRPVGATESEWRYASRVQYSLTIFTQSPPQSSLGHTRPEETAAHAAGADGIRPDLARRSHQ